MSVLLCLGLVAAVLVPVQRVAAASAPAESTAVALRDGGYQRLFEDGVSGARVRSFLDGGSGLLGFEGAGPDASSPRLLVEVSPRLASGTYRTQDASQPARADRVQVSVVRDDGWGCTDDTGTLTVHHAAYGGDGRPTEFDADLAVRCSPADSGLSYGVIRWHSSEPWGLSTATTSAGSKSVNAPMSQHKDVTVTVEARGNVPSRFGRTTLERDPLDGKLPSWRVVSDGCAGRSLPPHGSCDVVVRFAPCDAANYPVRVLVQDGLPSPLVVPLYGEGQSFTGMLTGLRVSGHYRHVELSWDAVTGVTVDHYVVYRVGPAGGRTLIGAPTATSFVDGPLADHGNESVQVASVAYGQQGRLSCVATVPTATTELYYAGHGGVAGQPLGTGQAATVQAAAGAGPTVSPDRRWLAYASTITYWAGGVAVQPIYVQPTDRTAEPYRLTDDQGVVDARPAWSPDSARVAFTRSHILGSDPSTTGPPGLAVADATPGGSGREIPGTVGLTDPAWMPDGATLVATDSSGPTQRLVYVDVATGARSPVPGGAGGSEPDVAPDGRILFTHAETDGTTTLRLLRPQDTVATVVVGVASGKNADPRWADDATAVVYSHDQRIQIAYPDSGTGEDLAVPGEQPALLRVPTAAAVDIARDACPPSRLAPASFTDVPAEPFGLAIRCLVANDLAHGETSSRYAPAAPVLRQQMAVFVLRLLRALHHAPADTSPSGFSDLEGVPAEERAAINALAHAGVVHGVDAGHYAPTRSVTRGQMAAYLARAQSLVEPWPAAPGYFGDTAASTFRADADRLAAAGITAGVDSPYHYRPDAPVTRQQMAAYLARDLQVNVRAGRMRPEHAADQTYRADPWGDVTVHPDGDTAGTAGRVVVRFSGLTGGALYQAALFPCPTPAADVIDADHDGHADGAGSSDTRASRIAVVNGADTAPSQGPAAVVSATDGTASLVVTSGGNDCTRAVLWRDTTPDAALDTSEGRAAEPYAATAAIRFE